MFLELAAIPSPPGEERSVADRVIAELEAMGLAWDEDDSGLSIGSTMGNILCRVPGGAGEGTPIFLCAHLDTVPPDGPLEPVIEDGVIRNAGGTILGADDKAAVAVMLEAVRRIVVERRPHAGIELLFTPKEEVGLVGAFAFDHNRLEARTGYVYDQAAPIGEIILGAPSQNAIRARFHGRASHSGMAPEDGRSAIFAASRAVADMRLGRTDHQSSANVGVISGGTARNIVPEWCTIDAEARSRDPGTLAVLTQEMLDAIGFAASTSDCTAETEVEQTYRGYAFAEDEPAVALAAEGLRRAGYEPATAFSGGAADANVFNERGLRCVNLGNGMIDIHTPDERIAVADLEAMVDVTLAIVDAARESW
ncbi:M20/M25/M40 family metallo-hydrolase [Gaiella sp.]|uniref:M20/M25/M40 family metallo-hydrolase n=1 Tax=Gaiella sp. TaxID=2663207 RepID=UPI003263AC5C